MWQRAMNGGSGGDSTLYILTLSHETNNNTISYVLTENGTSVKNGNISARNYGYIFDETITYNNVSFRVYNQTASGNTIYIVITANGRSVNDTLTVSNNLSYPYTVSERVAFF